LPNIILPQQNEDRRRAASFVALKRSFDNLRTFRAGWPVRGFTTFLLMKVLVFQRQFSTIRSYPLQFLLRRNRPKGIGWIDCKHTEVKICLHAITIGQMKLMKHCFQSNCKKRVL